jgi:hypothetical protein
VPSFTPAAAVLGIVGRKLDVELALAQNCDVGITMSAEVSVLDPSNHSVMVDSPTRSIQPDTTGVRTTVSFTPQLAGPYHVVVRFQPNLGIQQADVLVAANRTAEAPLYTLATMLSGCQHVELTPGQLLLCTTPHTDVYASDGGQLQTLEAMASAWSVDALWVLNGQGDLSRWTEGALADGGPGLVRSPDVAVPTTRTGSTSWLLPTSDDVVVLSSFVLTRFGVVDAGLSVTGEGMLIGGENWTAAWRGGDQLLAAVTAQLCTFSFDAGTGTCPPVAQTVTQVGMDRSGLWQLVMVFDGVGNPTSLNVVNATASASLALPPGLMPASPVLTWETSPVLDAATENLVLTAPHGDFSADAFPGGVLSASATAVTVLSDSLLKIYRR